MNCISECKDSRSVSPATVTLTFTAAHARSKTILCIFWDLNHSTLSSRPSSMASRVLHTKCLALTQDVCQIYRPSIEEADAATLPAFLRCTAREGQICGPPHHLTFRRGEVEQREAAVAGSKSLDPARVTATANRRVTDGEREREFTIYSHH